MPRAGLFRPMRAQGERKPVRERLRRIAGAIGDHKGAIGRGAIVVALLALAALPPFVDNTIIGYLPLLLVLSVIVLMAAYIAALGRCISFDERSGLKDCRRGEDVDFVVTVTNNSVLLVPRVDVRLYLSNLFGGVDTYTEQSFSLLPKETKEFRMQVRFDHIGQYRAGLHSLVVHDLVGLFSHRFTPGEGKQVMVMPNVVPLSRVEAVKQLALDNQRITSSIINDGMDYSGMRDYVPGDPFKSIHWKASARFETYLTRLFETQINPTMCIVLDGRCSWSGEDRLMEVYDAVMEAALSFDAYARENGFEHSLIMPVSGGGLSQTVLSGYADCVGVMRKLPSLVTDGSVMSASELVRTGLSGRYAANSVIVCSADFSRDLASTLVTLKGAGKSPVLVAARPSDLSSEERRQCARVLAPLADAQIPCFMFSDSRELRGGAW